MNFWDGGNLGDITDSIIDIFSKKINVSDEKKEEEDKFGKLLLYFNAKDEDEKEFEGIMTYQFRLFSVPKNMNERSKNKFMSIRIKKPV